MSAAWLQERWTRDEDGRSLYRLPVSEAVERLAVELGVTARALRQRFVELGFEPLHPYTLDEVMAALGQITTGTAVNSMGVTFAESLLRTEFGMVVRRPLIARALMELDPDGHARRQAEAAKTIYEYRVPGPRYVPHVSRTNHHRPWPYPHSTLTLDSSSPVGSTQLAVPHGCAREARKALGHLDSSRDRRVLALRRLPRRDQQQARGDRGAHLPLLLRPLRLAVARSLGQGAGEHAGHHGADRPSLRRVEAAHAHSGLSSHRPLDAKLPRGVHVALRADARLGQVPRRFPVDAAERPARPGGHKVHVFYLQTVFLPVVQDALDLFRRMWNGHKIKGRRTQHGCGGGVPSELFNDPILSATVLRDDEAYNVERGILGLDAAGRRTIDETSTFGTQYPNLCEDEHLQMDELDACDPLSGLELLQSVRSEYLGAYPVVFDSSGLTTQSSDVAKMERHIHAYVQMKHVCEQLVVCAQHFSHEDGYDWQGFATEPGLDTSTSRLRSEIAYFGWISSQPHEWTQYQGQPLASADAEHSSAFLAEAQDFEDD